MSKTKALMGCARCGQPIGGYDCNGSCFRPERVNRIPKPSNPKKS